MPKLKVVKRTADYTVFQKRSSRYAVKSADEAWVNGDDKARILLAEGLIETKLPEPEAPEEPADAEATAEEGTGEEGAADAAEGGGE